MRTLFHRPRSPPPAIGTTWQTRRGVALLVVRAGRCSPEERRGRCACRIHAAQAKLRPLLTLRRSQARTRSRQAGGQGAAREKVSFCRDKGLRTEGRRTQRQMTVPSGDHLMLPVTMNSLCFFPTRLHSLPNHTAIRLHCTNEILPPEGAAPNSRAEKVQNEHQQSQGYSIVRMAHRLCVGQRKGKRRRRDTIRPLACATSSALSSKAAMSYTIAGDRFAQTMIAIERTDNVATAMMAMLALLPNPPNASESDSAATASCTPCSLGTSPVHTSGAGTLTLAAAVLAGTRVPSRPRLGSGGVLDVVGPSGTGNVGVGLSFVALEVVLLCAAVSGSSS